jgi:hypothetical protein
MNQAIAVAAGAEDAAAKVVLCVFVCMCVCSCL